LAALPLLTVQGFRFLTGVRVATGELVCLRVELVGEELGIGNANVGDGAADDVPDALGAGDGAALEEGEELGVGLGAGEGGMIFSQ
jgi:hypothetical protein